MKSRNKSGIFRIAISVFWFLIIAFISYRMPMYEDDYIQSCSMLTGEPITSIDMILPSVAEFYRTVNGRFIAFFFIQLMLYVPRMVFAIINAAVYVLMVLAAYRYVHISMSEDTDTGILSYSTNETSGLMIMYVMSWFMMPVFAEVITWPSGCVNYLWMNCLILLFALPYYRDFVNSIRNKYGEPSLDTRESDDRKSVMAMICRILLALITGLCAGWSLESSAAVLVFALILYSLWMIRHHQHIAVDRICGIISCFIGAGFLILAPGNRARGSGAVQASETAGFFVNYAHRFGRETFYALLYLTVPLAVFILIYMLSGRRISFREVVENTLAGQEFLFILFGFAGVYVMTFSPGFAGRIYQFPLIMIMIAGVMAYHRLSEQSERITVISRSVTVFCVVMMTMAVVEVTAGTLYASQAGSFFDRQMLYYHISDVHIADLLPGNGVVN